MALLLRHARSVVRRVMLLHNAKATLGNVPVIPDTEDWRDYKLTWDQVCQYYPGAQTWSELHQFFVEHYASQEGFAVGATVRLAQTQLLEEKQRAESSIQTEGGRSNGAIKPGP